MTDIINIRQLVRITNRLCNIFYRAAEHHRKKMTKSMLKRKPMNIDGGKEIRIPLNYGKGGKP